MRGAITSTVRSAFYKYGSKYIYILTYSGPKGQFHVDLVSSPYVQNCSLDAVNRNPPDQQGLFPVGIVMAAALEYSV